MHPELLNNSLFLRYYQQWQDNPAAIVFVPLAEFLLLYDRVDDALAICRQGLQHHPNLVSGRIMMAKVHIKRGNWEEAETELMHALFVMPENTTARTMLEEIKELRQREDAGQVSGISAVDEDEPISPDAPLRSSDADAEEGRRQALPDDEVVMPGEAFVDAVWDANGQESFTEGAPALQDEGHLISSSVPAMEERQSLFEDPQGDPAALREETSAEGALPQEHHVPQASSELSSEASTWEDSVAPRGESTGAFADDASPDAERMDHVPSPLEEDRSVELPPVEVMTDAGETQEEHDEEASFDAVRPLSAESASWQTVTMAKIFAQQGYRDRARDIYQRILSRDPQNEAARQGMQTLAPRPYEEAR